MLPEFNIVRPDCVEEAVKKLATEKYRIIAGGTDIIVEMRNKLSIEFDLMDITGLDELKHISEKGSRIHIGALVSFSDIFYSETIQNKAPILKAAVKNAGSVQIRNRATIGGNICNASPAADSVPALVALNAAVHLIGSRGSRDVPVEEFITGPYRIAIKKDEILSGVSFNKTGNSYGYSFYKLGRREALAISRMNVAVMLNIEDGKINDAVISPGSVMPAPGRIKEAEEIILGREPSPEVFRLAGEKVARVMVEKSGIRWSTEYKKPVIQTMVARALSQAAKKRI